MKQLPADSGAAKPPLPTQRGFWDDWNRTWRFGRLDGFMDRQREVALSVARSKGLHDGRILDVGCGTGWLGNALQPFGRVWATDLSEAATAAGQGLHPQVEFICGDFLTIDLPGPFDFVVSADSIINMYDQGACVQRIAALLRPGGTLLLMTPNREIWRFRSKLKPLGPGQVQRWLSLDEYTALLRPYFGIESVRTIDPGGDSGWLWWVENRYIRRGMGLVFGRRRWRALLERARLGRELVFVARRK